MVAEQVKPAVVVTKLDIVVDSANTKTGIDITTPAAEQKKTTAIVVTIAIKAAIVVVPKRNDRAHPQVKLTPYLIPLERHLNNLSSTLYHHVFNIYLC